MPTRSSKKNLKSDINVLAKSIVAQSTGAIPHEDPPLVPMKNPNAVALGKLGGTKGGVARAKSLSPKRRRQ